MKKKSAILCGVSTLALAATLAYADTPTNLNLAPNANPPGAAAAPADKITTSASATVGSPGEAGNVSQTIQNNDIMQKLHDNVAFDYFGVYRGSNVGDPGGRYQPGYDAPAGGPGNGAQSLESFVTAGWKPAKDWMVGINTHFMYNSDTAPDQFSPNNPQASAGIQLLDPSFVVTKANLIDRGQFKVKGYLYVEIPVTHFDYITVPGNNMLTSVAPTANITYDFKDSRFSVGTYTYVRGYIPGPNSPDDLRTYRFVAAPYGSYQITPTVAASLWVDLIDLRRTGGSPFFSAYGLQNEEGDIEPGISWDVLPGRLTVNPILNIFTGNPTLATTSFQAVIIGHAW